MRAMLIAPQSRNDLFKISCVADAIRGPEKMKTSSKISLETAEIIALKGLDFLAQEPERLGRFIALTGIGPEELRDRAGTPALLAAVLEHFLSDESSLLVFASLHNVSTDDIAPAHGMLASAAESAQSTPTSAT